MILESTKQTLTSVTIKITRFYLQGSPRIMAHRGDREDFLRFVQGMLTVISLGLSAYAFISYDSHAFDELEVADFQQGFITIQLIVSLIQVGLLMRLCC